jgi:hypothetical protein
MWQQTITENNDLIKENAMLRQQRATIAVGVAPTGRRICAGPHK